MQSRAPVYSDRPRADGTYRAGSGARNSLGISRRRQKIRVRSSATGNRRGPGGAPEATLFTTPPARQPNAPPSNAGMNPSATQLHPYAHPTYETLPHALAHPHAHTHARTHAPSQSPQLTAANPALGAPRSVGIRDSRSTTPPPPSPPPTLSASSGRQKTPPPQGSATTTTSSSSSLSHPPLPRRHHFITWRRHSPDSATASRQARQQRSISPSCLGRRYE